MKDLPRVAIAGGSGFAGGELLRLLLDHAQVRVTSVSSERFAGKPVTRLHPNLRTRTNLVFCELEHIEEADLLFLCLPHKHSSQNISKYQRLAPRLIDLSGDFRLNSAEDYRVWYGGEHPRPDLLSEFVYGIPELHREQMKNASYVSSAGCNATAVILALYPLCKADILESPSVISEVKVGSSEGGNSFSEASHHPVRSGCVRSFKPTGHRHSAEIEQELSAYGDISVHFSATSIEMVRGVLSTSHVFLRSGLGEKDVWKAYRDVYADEPFIRIVKDRSGIYRYPEPKLLAGTNYCDIGFEKEERNSRLVVISAIDNLMKGAAGQAVQAMNIMLGYPERQGLEFSGLHPI